MEEYFRIGKIDIKKLGEFSEKILNNEVILTEERIEHIRNKHNNDFDELEEYIREVISEPDYILKDGEHIDTVILLKEIVKNELKIKMIIKLATYNDIRKYNSIITFWKIRDRDYNKTIKKCEILYKKV